LETTRAVAREQGDREEQPLRRLLAGHVVEMACGASPIGYYSKETKQLTNLPPAV
jgi:hypothetical protein